MLNILVIGPHPDDQEIGMGGTIARLASQGHSILLLDLTDGCPTPVGDRPTRLREAADAASILASTDAKIDARPAGGSVRRVLLDLPNRRLEHSLEARHMVAGVIRAHQAQVLFLPHPEDAHPDHLAATRIAEDARFDAKLTGFVPPVPPGYDRPGGPIYPSWVFYYYCSHLRRVADPTFLIDTSGEFTQRKRRAIEAYRSQFALNPRNASFPERASAADVYFGSRIGAAAAEPFWTREPLGLTGLDALAGIA